jgi:hypothetical protein
MAYHLYFVFQETKEESIQENRQQDSGGKRGKAQRRRRQSRVGSTGGGHTPGYMQVRKTSNSLLHEKFVAQWSHVMFTK